MMEKYILTNILISENKQYKMPNSPSLDIIAQFWKNNFTIWRNEGNDPSQFLTETNVKNLFSEKYPQFDIQSTQTFGEFVRKSLALDLGIKRIRGRARIPNYRFNVSLKQPNLKSTDFYLWNARGLITTNGNNRSQALADFMHPNTLKMIALTETHLTSDHLDEEITSKFQGYTLHRSDRDIEIGRKSKCGGVALLASENLVSVKTDAYSNGCCELLKVDFDEISTTVIVIYRPPDTMREEFNQILTRLTNHLTTNIHENILLAGDFNFPSTVVTWE